MEDCCLTRKSLSTPTETVIHPLEGSHLYPSQNKITQANLRLSRRRAKYLKGLKNYYNGEISIFFRKDYSHPLSWRRNNSPCALFNVIYRNSYFLDLETMISLQVLVLSRAATIIYCRQNSRGRSKNGRLEKESSVNRIKKRLYKIEKWEINDELTFLGY